MNLKLPSLNFKLLLITIVLGIIAALVVYQAQIRGLAPSFTTLPRTPSLELRTVVQEESTVTLAIEKAVPSVVAIGSGTGFIVESKGLIITNKNIVTGPGSYTIVTKDGQKYELKKIYNDPNSDLSLIEIDATGLPALELGDSTKLKLGQTVIALGQKGQSINASVGVVSGLNGSIQTDAVINPDNLGGPLLSSAGQVIGVSVAVAGTRAFGSVISSDYIKQFISQSMIQSAAVKPYLGLKINFVSKEATLNSNPGGAVVQEVISGGPAETVGIKSGDIITAINGQAIDTENKVSEIVSKSRIGQQLELTIWRNGEESKLTVVVVQAPKQ